MALRITGPVLLAALALVVAIAGVGCSFGPTELESEAVTTTDVAPASAAEGEVAVSLDASARPASSVGREGEAPDHLRFQPFIDLGLSQLESPVLVTFEAVGTEAGPIEPAHDALADPRQSTSVQQVVDAGSGRRGLSSVDVDLPCPLGEACTARWRYRIEPLTSGDAGAARLVWGVDARAVYSRGDQARRVPEGATMDVVIDAPRSGPALPEPAVVEAIDLADGATITVSAPPGSRDGVVRVALLDGANGTAMGFGFLLADAGDRAVDAVVMVGPSIWEVPFAASVCDTTSCTVRLAVEGSPPPGSTLRVDTRAGPDLGAAPTTGQIIVTTS